MFSIIKQMASVSIQGPLSKSWVCFFFLEDYHLPFLWYQKISPFYWANTAVITFNAHDPLMSSVITHLISKHCFIVLESAMFGEHTQY